MKRVVLSILTVVVSSWCLAAEISNEQAMKKARAFLSGKSVGRRAADVTLRTARTGVKQLHAFNVEGGGFVIVSASKHTEAVLGYSTTGSMDDNLPPAMIALLQSYGQQIAEAEQKGGEPVDNVQGSILVKQAIEPLIKMKWGQDEPYNNMTPTTEKDGKEVHCPTGCVATAMAMLMRYHQWPQGATQVIPATIFYEEDLPATTFNWAAMTDTYNEKSSKESRDAVALLMKYCGAACKMNYDADQSASNSTQLALGLLRYMGYDYKSIQMTRRTFLSESEWQNLIYGELIEKRPVIADGDGHEFIIDGYQEGDYFHINWGWDGNKDGFFRISITGGKLAPTTRIHHFPYAVITGIKPTGDSYVYEDALTTQGLMLTPDTPMQMERSGDTDFAEVKVLLNLQNVCSQQKTYTFDTGMALYKEDMMQKAWGISYNNTVKYDGYLENQQAKMEFGQGLEDGHYRLYPVSRVSGTQEWLRNEDVSLQYIDVEICGEQMTLKDVPRYHRLIINDIKVYGNLTTGGEVTAVMNITNDSDSGYDGVLVLVNDIDGTSEKAETLKETYCPIPAGKTVDVPFTFIAGDAKTYHLCFLYEVFLWGTRVPMVIQDGGDNPPSDNCLIEKTVTLKNGQYTGKDTYGFSIYQIKGRVMDATVTLKNTDPTNTYRGVAQLDIEYDSTTGNATERLVTLPKLEVTIAPGQTEEVHFYYDKLDRMKTYYMNLYTTYNGHVNLDTQSLTVNMEMVTGINVFKDDRSVVSTPPTPTFEVPADAVAVELYDAGVTTLTPNDNPNCLYFFNKTDGIPACLEGRNVAVYDTDTNWTTAEKVTLDDNYSFLSPIVFTAKDVNYQRSFTEAEHSGYTSLVLPFDVQTCEAGGQLFTANYFAFNADEPGKVYVLEEEGPLQAGKPYIVQLKAETPLTAPVTFSAKNVDITSSIRMESAGHYSMTGSFQQEQYTETECFSFGQGESGTSIPKTNTCYPFRACFQTIGIPSNLESLAIVNTLDPTGIVAPRSKTSENDEPYYNMLGQRVNKSQKGLVIYKGRKYLNK